MRTTCFASQFHWFYCGIIQWSIYVNSKQTQMNRMTTDPSPWPLVMKSFEHLVLTHILAYWPISGPPAVHLHSQQITGHSCQHGPPLHPAAPGLPRILRHWSCLWNSYNYNHMILPLFYIVLWIVFISYFLKECVWSAFFLC